MGLLNKNQSSPRKLLDCGQLASKTPTPPVRKTGPKPNHPTNRSITAMIPRRDSFDQFDMHHTPTTSSTSRSPLYVQTAKADANNPIIAGEKAFREMYASVITASINAAGRCRSEKNRTTLVFLHRLLKGEKPFRLGHPRAGCSVESGQKNHNLPV